MTTGMSLQKEAVACGYWPLYHFDPRDEAHPFHLDSKKPTGDFKEFAMKEARFAMLARSKPEASARLLDLAQEDINARWHFYEQLAGVERAAAARRRRQRRRTKPKTAKEVNCMSVDLTTKYLGLDPEEPAGDRRLPADPASSTRSSSWKRGRGRRRAPLALRGADRARRDGDGPRPRDRHRELRRVAHLLPRGGRLPRRARKATWRHRRRPSRR